MLQDKWHCFLNNLMTCKIRVKGTLRDKKKPKRNMNHVMCGPHLNFSLNKVTGKQF